MTIQRAFVAALKSRFFSLAIAPVYSGASFSSTALFTISRNGNPWTLPLLTTIGDGYEVRVTHNSGTAPTSGTLGSWLALTSDRTWQLTNNVAGTSLFSNVTIEVRIAGGGAIVASQTLDLEAEVFP